MPPLIVEVFGFTVRTFTFVVALSIIIASVSMVYRVRRAMTIGHAVDVCLIMLVVGYALARLQFIAFDWTYFSRAHLPIREWVLPMQEGGLGWHGAFIGALIGLWIGARWLHLSMRRLITACAPAFLVIAFGGWVGCMAAGCAYGIEVDTLAHYPPLVVVEARDIYGIIAPRYFTQGYGVVLVLALSVIFAAQMLKPKSITPRRGGTHTQRLFWCGVAIFSLGMFVIGFFRADAAPTLFGLRADQAGDMLVTGWGIINIFIFWKSQ